MEGNELNIAFQFILILENYIQTNKLCHCIWNIVKSFGKKVMIFIDVCAGQKDCTCASGILYYTGKLRKT